MRKSIDRATRSTFLDTRITPVFYMETGQAGVANPRTQGRAASRSLLVGADALSICAPIYEELPGWQESTEGVQRFEDLPGNAQAYLRRLEVLVGAPIAIISTGPDRSS